MSKKGILAYDICSAPDGINIDKIISVWKEHNFVIYDSKLGSKPELFDAKVETILVDVSNTTPEILNQIQKLIKT